MKVLIIEDEPIAAKQIEQILSNILQDLELLAVLDSVSACKKWFSANSSPDLIISDIELLDGNIFSFFKSNTIDAPVIFSTAYDTFLIDAFNANGIAYILKPFQEKDFEAALKKYNRLKDSLNLLNTEIALKFDQLLNNKTSYRQRFIVRVAGDIFLFDIEQVALLKSEDGLVLIFDINGRRFPLTGTLSEQESALDPDRFFRINRSCLIHIKAIEKMSSYGKERMAVYMQGCTDPVITAASKTSAFRRWIDR